MIEAVTMIKPGVLAFSGSLGETTKQRHHAIQIAFAIRGKIDASIGDARVKADAILISKNVAHWNYGPGGYGCTVFIEPMSLWGDSIARVYDTDFRVLEIGRKSRGKLARAIAEKGTDARGLIASVMELLRVKSAAPSLDDRIGRLVGMIEAGGLRKAAPGDPARASGLSESRMQHLFKLSAGISLKRYLLWKRMIDGMVYILRGENFTQAAYSAGFSDSAHLSRAFRSMFGACPRMLFHDSRSVQARILNME